MLRAVREAMDDAISRIAAYGVAISDVRITSWAAARLWLRTLTLTSALTIGDVNKVHLRLAMKARFPSASFNLTISDRGLPSPLHRLGLPSPSRGEETSVSCAPLVGVSTGTDWQCGSIELEDNLARVLDWIAGSLAGSIRSLDITNCRSPKI